MKALKTLLKLVLGLAAALALVIAGLLLFAPGIHVSSLQMILNVMTGAGGDTADDELLARLRVGGGYQVSIFARDIANPRLLHHTAAGRLLVTSPRSGEVIQLEDTDGDGVAEGRQVLLSGLARPHGIEVYDGQLYVAESHQVGRQAYDIASGTLSGEYQVVVGGLTDNGNHWSKSIRFDDSGRLYVSMGSTCNVCEETDTRRATIMRYAADGGEGEVFASGLRNSVGLAFAPWDGALYATDNGRDLLGDDYPPCELNRIVEGGFYGWPYLNGDNKLDPDWGAGRESLRDTAIVPAFSFRAHNAPLGIHFIPGQKSALVALHGSWNRSIPDGYKVVRLNWRDDGSIAAEDFMWGFEESGDIVGRPVDIVSDGSGGFYVSDDFARVIYRLSPAGSAFASAAPTTRSEVAQPAALDMSLATQGQALFAAMPCGDCHGITAMTPVELRDLAQRYSIDSLADYFLTPTPPMPRFELSLEQRRQLAHYLLSREQFQAEM